MILRILVGIFLLLLGWNSLTKTTNKSDFQDYYMAAQRFTQSEDIYAVEDILEAQKKIKTLDEIFLPENAGLLDTLLNHTGSYIYPPSFAFMLIPISDWEYENAGRFFALLNYLSLLGSIFLIFLMFRRDMNPNYFWGSLFLALLFSFRFLENHINNNQVAFILMFLVLLSVHSRNNLFSGILLSLAIVVKLTPAVFLVYFFYKRRWMALFWTTIFLVFWVFLPGVYSWEQNIRYLGNWNDMVLQSAMKTPLFRAWQNNQSMIATLAKYFLSFADPVNQPQKGMPWIELSQKTVQLIFYGIFIVFGLSLVRSLYNKHQSPSTSKVVSMLFILSVVFSGIAWIHSFSFFLFPLFFLFRELLEGGMNSRERKFFYLGLGLLFLTNRNIIGSDGEGWALMLSSLLYGGVVLFFLTANLTEEEKSQAQEAGPIRIAVDARPLAYGVTGNSRYLAEVLNVLGRDSQNYRFLLFSHRGIHPVFQDVLELPAVELVSLKSWIPGPIWLHTVFPWLSYVSNAKILWGTLQLLPAFGKFCPNIVNYHDLNVKSSPQTMAKWNLFQHRLLSGRTLKRADSILCLSQNTINDIAKHFPEFKDKTKLVYPGVSKIADPVPPAESKKFGKFLFTLGTLEPRKNLKTLINGYLGLKDENPNYPYFLVAAGRAGWGLEENMLREALKRGDYQARGIFFLENPSEENLSWLYKNSKAFLFPSLHEGFGLPLLEAMREGKNCIASKIPVFSEILDNELDRVVPPLDEIAWKEAMEIFVKTPPPKRVWNPKDWTWKATSEIIAGEIRKFHAL